MIEATYPSIRKKHALFGTPFVMGTPHKQAPFPVVQYTAAPSTRTLNLMDKWAITYEEFKRRDEIIHELFRMCPYVKGDRVVPKDANKRKQYGILTIVGICRDLFDLEHDNVTWPLNDNPMIVTCTSEKEGDMWCTTNFFMRAPSGSKC